MPDFGTDDVNPNSWGYDFSMMTKLFTECIEKHSKNKKVTIIMHDWGCYYGYMIMTQRPDLVNRCVSLDIGGYQEFDFWHR